MNKTEAEADLANRQLRIAREMRQLKDDADHWNSLHPDEPPIVVDMDLTADVAKRMAQRKARAKLNPG